jgi:hypothetical protein
MVPKPFLSYSAIIFYVEKGLYLEAISDWYLLQQIQMSKHFFGFGQTLKIGHGI